MPPAELRVYASLQHYWEHLAPVVDALQSATTQPLRGVHAPQGRSWGGPLPRDRSGGLWLVASAADVKRLGPGVPVIYLEHGAGQSYHGDPAAAGSMSYAGGDGLDEVVLFLCPNETVAARWHHRYPDAALAVVGCPKLDRWHANPVTRNPDRPTVAVTFHWPNTLCPESQWALPHYRPALPRLAAELAGAGVELVGHGHPRAWRQLRREWHRLGVRPVESLAQVFDEADVLVVDNSSAGPEFASLGRPIVWLSAPWYRRDVDHGGRFWDWTEGVPHVEDPEQLVPTVEAVLTGDGHDEGHARLVRSVYAHTDGDAARRAADAILEVCERWVTPTPRG